MRPIIILIIIGRPAGTPARGGGRRLRRPYGRPEGRPPPGSARTSPQARTEEKGGGRPGGRGHPKCGREKKWAPLGGGPRFFSRDPHLGCPLGGGVNPLGGSPEVLAP